jgi:hypothetical protein
MPLEDFLTQSCTILVQGTGQSRSGAPVRVPYTAIASDVPCLLREMGGSNDRRDGKASETNTVRIYFDPEDLASILPLTTRHQIQIGPRTFVVTTSVDPNSLGRLLQVDCTEQRV